MYTNCHLKDKLFPTEIAKFISFEVSEFPLQIYKWIWTLWILDKIHICLQVSKIHKLKALFDSQMVR